MTLEKRILVVDDDDAIRALLRTVLRRRGFVVDTARNGVDALEKLAERRYALVVLDLMMPHMSGYELVEQLDKLSVMTRPRVLILTAAGAVEPRGLATSLVIGAMHKPFDIDLLIDTIRGFLASMPPLPQRETAAEPAVTPSSQLN